MGRCCRFRYGQFLLDSFLLRYNRYIVLLLRRWFRGCVEMFRNFVASLRLVYDRSSDLSVLGVLHPRFRLPFRVVQSGVARVIHGLKQVVVLDVILR